MYQGSGLPVNYIFPALLFMKYLWSVWRTQDTKNDIIKIINSFLKMYYVKCLFASPPPICDLQQSWAMAIDIMKLYAEETLIVTWRGVPYMSF